MLEQLSLIRLSPCIKTSLYSPNRRNVLKYAVLSLFTEETEHNGKTECNLRTKRKNRVPLWRLDIAVIYCRRRETLNKLTLRVLMSSLYMEHPFLMFLDHTQRRTTVGRTPLDE